MNRIIIILIGATLTACSTQTGFTGKYVYVIPDWIDSEIVINNDSTFLYTYQSGLERTVVSGKWKKDGKFLTLNSNEQQLKDSLSVKELIIQNSNIISFMLTDFNNIPVQSTVIAILQDSSHIIEINEDGIGLMKNKQNLKEIIIMEVGHQYTYSVKDPNSNLFKIKVNFLRPSQIYFRFFSNETWLLKRNKIIDLSNNKKTKYCKNGKVKHLP